MPLPSLFAPITIAGLALSNRLVMAPMTRRMSLCGIPAEDVAAYYGRRAEGGVGLVITEGTGIADPAALAEANVPEFHGAGLEGWAQVVAEVHAAGARIFPQLWHVGSARRPAQTATPHLPAVSPSGLFSPDEPNGETLSEARIAAIIAAYGAAAAAAQRIGCDGIELHFAHGYLVDQFLWRPTNRRTDRWGETRWLMAREVVAECRRAVGPAFPLCVRFSQWKQQDYAARLFETPGELETFLAPIVDAGADIFHCSTRRFWEPEFPGSPMNLAGWTKRLSGKPVITVGSVGLDADFLTTRVGDDPLTDAAQWGNKVREGRFDAITPFTRAALGSLD